MKIEKIVTGALEENCYVLSFEGTCLIVDPGSDFTKIKMTSPQQCHYKNNYSFLSEGTSTSLS